MTLQGYIRCHVDGQTLDLLTNAPGRLVVTMSARSLVVEASLGYRMSFASSMFVSTAIGVFLVDLLIRGLPDNSTSWSQQIIRSVSFSLLGSILVLCTNAKARRVRLELRDDAVVIPRLLRRIEVRWGDVDKVVLRAEQRYPWRDNLDFVLRDGTEGARRLGTFVTILISGSNVKPDDIQLDISSRQPRLNIIRRQA